MKKDKSIERIAFLAKKFNVFTNEEYEEFLKVDESCKTVVNNNDAEEIIALYSIKRYDNGDAKLDDNGHVIAKWIGVHENVFIKMVQADPTVNKVYVQWMLTVFNKYLKHGQEAFASRFACEDLPQAEEYLILFDGNKFKQSFKRMCESNFAFKGITDPTNINQYQNLSQLFDAVDPYIKRDVSQLETGMEGFVKRGEAEIPFKDRRFTIYTPFSKEASGLLRPFASWCTTNMGYTNHNSYTLQKTPQGVNSKLYVVVDNEFFKDSENQKRDEASNGGYSGSGGEGEQGLWQLHFESGQIMNKSNRRENDFKGSVLDKSEGISKYFYDLLIDMARAGKGNMKENKYVKHLMKFGFCDVLFEILKKDIDGISFLGENIPKLPDMSKFKNLRSLYLFNVKLEELHDSVGKLKNLGTLSLPNNKLTTIPKSICYLKELAVINLNGNKISEIPDELRNLDRQNGGGLIRIVFGKGEISTSNLEKVRKLLPTTEIVEFKIG